MFGFRWVLFRQGIFHDRYKLIRYKFKEGDVVPLKWGIEYTLFEIVERRFDKFINDTGDKVYEGYTVTRQGVRIERCIFRENELLA